MSKSFVFGRWLVDKSKGHMGIYCSHCDARFLPQFFADNLRICPVCGVPMRKEIHRISEQQLSEMMHCIGMDLCGAKHKPYQRHGRYFYRPWRNYFATGAKCDNSGRWLDLEMKGFAAREKDCWTFWLTRRGLDLLEDVLNVKIYGREDEA